jgi:uracil-DNA glycosylase family 4
MTLEELADQIKKCQLCELAKGRQNAVPGQGNEHADIMFIGEGPGANEDKQGIPFCGASGRFLDDLLASINLARQDVFITNVVKCRPPENRDPLPHEIETCTKHYLYNQIDAIDPKVICFLGRYSMGLFMKDMKISKVHGKAFRKDNRFYVAFYHPAVALYNGSMRPVLLEDFKVLQKILQGKYKVKDPVIEEEEGELTLPTPIQKPLEQLPLDL